MNVNEIERLMRLFEESSLTEMEVEENGCRLYLSKQKSSTTKTEPEPADTNQYIQSEYVGTFYAGPSPEQPPYVESGTHVKEGQIVCIVESMKQMHEIISPITGVIEEVLVSDEEKVEYGQKLFRIKGENE